jgi:hypothetical protein
MRSTKVLSISVPPSLWDEIDMNIDIAPDGTVYGVELLNANEQLTGDQGALIVESGGRRQKIPLVA